VQQKIIKETKMKKKEERQIELKANNTVTNDPCGFCGYPCNPNGFDYFVKGTWELVCDSCAEKYAPDLVKIQEEVDKFLEMRDGWVS
jgi:hypothetical protein